MLANQILDIADTVAVQMKNPHTITVNIHSATDEELESIEQSMHNLGFLTSRAINGATNLGTYITMKVFDPRDLSEDQKNDLEKYGYKSTVTVFGVHRHD